MNNRVKNKCIEYCAYIYEVTGVNNAVIDIVNREFYGKTYSEECGFDAENKCNAYNTHLYGAIESERWSGTYTYYCPLGSIFIATAINDDAGQLEGAIITGPITMVDEDDSGNNSFEKFGGNDIPILTTKQTHALSKMIHIMMGNSADTMLLERENDSEMQGKLLNSMYEVSDKIKDGNTVSKLLELEKVLVRHIGLGDKEASSEVINEILGYIYFTSGGDFETIRARTLELLVILSRSSIDSGADANEIFWLSESYIKRINEFSDLESLSRWTTVVMHKFISSTFEFTNIKHKDVMFKISEYIKSNYAQKITLEDLSEHVYLSKSYLSRLFKEELDCTFTKYVNNIRVEKSKILLMRADIPIVDIAYAVGFDDQSYFTKVFKKIAKISPGKYREMRCKD